MFDIGFQELLLIGIVALLVVGPERLPRLARTTGIWLGKARRMVNQVKVDVERELHAEELKQMMNSPDSLGDIYGDVGKIKDDMTQVMADFSGDVSEPKPQKASSLDEAETTPALEAEDREPKTSADGEPRV